MIDILMAVYQGEAYVAEQIESILKQTYTDWTLLIGDDGSKDRTMEILLAYEAKYPSKIRVVQNKVNSGSAQANFFRLLSLSESAYAMTCDHDDVWLPDKVEKTMGEMERLERENPPGTPILVHTDLEVVDENLRTIAPSMFRLQNLDSSRVSLPKLLAQNVVTGCTMLANRPLLDLAKDPPGSAIMHDWWLALVAAAFGKIGFVSESTIRYRQHGNNEVGAKNVRDPKYVAARLSKTEQIHKVLTDTYRQAAGFYERYQGRLSKEQAELVLGYAKMPEYGKLHRMAHLLRNGHGKNGLVRKAGQLLFA